MELGDAAEFTTYSVKAGIIVFEINLPENLMSTEAQIRIQAEEQISEENNSPILL